MLGHIRPNVPVKNWLTAGLSVRVHVNAERRRIAKANVKDSARIPCSWAIEVSYAPNRDGSKATDTS
jgi:hypothetical protein